jgi:hypothetical protein
VRDLKGSADSFGAAISRTSPHTGFCYLPMGSPSEVGTTLQMCSRLAAPTSKQRPHQTQPRAIRAVADRPRATLQRDALTIRTLARLGNLNLRAHDEMPHNNAFAWPRLDLPNRFKFRIGKILTY